MFITINNKALIQLDIVIPQSQFKRLQFPIRLAFSMTINKSRGQKMVICGLNLEHPCFPWNKPSNIFIFIPDRLTRNIVHDLALRCLKKNISSTFLFDNV